MVKETIRNDTFLFAFRMNGSFPELAKIGILEYTAPVLSL